MSNYQPAARILACCLTFVVSGVCQQPHASPPSRIASAPRVQQAPKSASIIRNSTQTDVSVEYQIGDQWQQISLGPGKESTVTGTHIRVATTREDNAMIIVVLPIVGGKKYEVIRNDTCGIWDFRNVTDTSPPTH